VGGGEGEGKGKGKGIGGRTVADEDDGFFLGAVLGL
jgi:hypothetical protein